MPATPISHYGWRRGESATSALIGLARAWRPMVISAIITGKPISKVPRKYTNKILHRRWRR